MGRLEHDELRAWRWRDLRDVVKVEMDQQAEQGEEEVDQAATRGYKPENVFVTGRREGWVSLWSGKREGSKVERIPGLGLRFTPGGKGSSPVKS